MIHGKSVSILRSVLPLAGLAALASPSVAAPQVPPPAPVRPWALQVILDPTPQKNTTFGVNIAALDFDRDGFTDLAIGAPGENTMVGEVWIFRGPSFAAASAIPLVSALSRPGDRYGSAVVAGDLDGDGWEEIVVGALKGDPGGAPGAGYASVWEWLTSVPWERCTIGASVAEVGSAFGGSATIAEVDPTPGAEVIIGQSKRTVPPAGWTSGSFQVFSCRSGLLPVHLATIDNPNSTHDNGNFGGRLCAGDWNGDGRDDVYATGIFNDAFDGVTTWPFAGQVFVYAGPFAGGAMPTVTIDNPTPWTDPIDGSCDVQRFGMFIDAADVDGDGFGELAVGTPRKDILTPTAVCEAGTGFLFSGASFVPYTGTFIELFHPTPMQEDLMSYRVHFGDHIGGSKQDLVLCALPHPSTTNRREVFLWSGGGLLSGFGSAGAPTRRFEPLLDSGAHWPDGIENAQLDGLGHEELILGDRDYTPPGGPSRAGRVVIYFMP